MIVDETMGGEINILNEFEELETPDGCTDRQWGLFFGARARQAQLAESMLIAPQKDALLTAYQILGRIAEDGSYDFDEVNDFLDYFTGYFRNTIESFCDEGETTEKENIQ